MFYMYIHWNYVFMFFMFMFLFFCVFVCVQPALVVLLCMYCVFYVRLTHVINIAAVTHLPTLELWKAELA